MRGRSDALRWEEEIKLITRHLWQSIWILMEFLSTDSCMNNIFSFWSMNFNLTSLPFLMPAGPASRAPPGRGWHWRWCCPRPSPAPPGTSPSPDRAGGTSRVWLLSLPAPAGPGWTGEVDPLLVRRHSTAKWRWRSWRLIISLTFTHFLSSVTWTFNLTSSFSMSSMDSNSSFFSMSSNFSTEAF